MDRPGRRDHGLFIVHPDMAGFVHWTHKMRYGLSFGYIKVEIDFHTAIVSMRRHRVPYRTRFELGHTHLKLASLNDGMQEHLVDDTVVGRLHTAQFDFVGIFFCHATGRKCMVSWCGVEIEFCRILAIVTAEIDFLRSFSNVQSLFMVDDKDFSIYLYVPVTAYIDDAQFTTGQEMWLF